MTKKIETAEEWGIRHVACSDAMEWLRSLPEGTTMTKAWLLCQRSDWMLWALHRVHATTPGGPRSFACDCAERALTREREAGREPDPRSWAAVREARSYLLGESSVERLAAARDAAWAAAGAAAGDAAWAAARAAECAWQADRLRHYVPEWPGEVDHG